MPYHKDSLQGRLLAGDREALRLVRRWIAEALSAARWWRLRAEWKDIQQEVLSRLVDSLRQERFRADGEFKSYVQGICRHTAQNWRVRPAGRTAAARPGYSTQVPPGGDLEQQLISDQLVRNALDEASAECSELIRAYFLEGLSYAELAARLDIPVGTVKSRLFRCLQCLRDSMAPASSRPRQTTR